MPDKRSTSSEGRFDLESILLEGRTRVPSWHPGAVSRRRLIDRARGRAERVVSVTAPAGYGKSTLLAEWASRDPRNVAWATLDRTDGDPVSLLSILAAASASVSPAAEAVVSDMRGIGSAPLGRSAPLLAAAIADAPASFILFIDDLHWADSPACQDALEVLLARVPEGSQVVIASRREPPLIARLRAAGAAQEITTEDLTVDRSEARVIFYQAGVDGIADAMLDRIVERCEGWPTGLYLCALVERAGGQATSVTGEDPFLADYLYSECVARLPQDLRAFLRRAAILDQMSAASCNAVLRIDDARARLREIEAANLFLVPMDRHRRWFRFHALFRDFLRGELERVDGPAVVTELHRRAASWLKDNGARPVAVDHLIQAGEIERAVELVADIALPMYQAGHIATVRRWLGELGDEVVGASPPLAVLMGWVAVLLGDVADGMRWSRIIDAVDASRYSDMDRVSFVSARAMLRAAMGPGGHSQVYADAAYAMEHEPSSSPWRDQALHLWGSACLLEGDVETARAAFVEAIDVATAMGNVDSIFHSEPELALLAIDDMRWDLAAVHASHGVAVIESNHMDGYPTTALALAVAARVVAHEGDRDRAQRLLARAMVARVGCTQILPWMSIRARLQIAKAHIALGDRAAARHLMHEIDDLLRRQPDLGTLRAQIEEFRTHLADAPGSAGTVPLTSAELRLLPYLQTHLTYAEIGERLFISRNTVGTEVASIYRKLAATSRSSAVARAIELGLLGG